MTDNFKYYEDNNRFPVMPQGRGFIISLRPVFSPGVNDTKSTERLIYPYLHIGTRSDIMSRTPKYVKIQSVDKPLSVRRKKAWSYKTTFSNTYRGRDYTGSLEMYIYKPHLIDIEQSWYQPTITVRLHSGMDAVVDFTLEQFENTIFYKMIVDVESLTRTYNDIRTYISTIRTDIIRGD